MDNSFQRTALQEIAQFLEEPISSVSSTGGGSISQAYTIKTATNNYFLKLNPRYPKLFEKEYNGLKELSQSGVITPKVHLATSGYILMDCITSGLASESFFRRLGEAFANMHRFTSTTFGFYEDNYIGTTPQYNLTKDKAQISWCDFYLEKRLLPQYLLAEKKGYLTKEFKTGFRTLENKITSILSGSEEPPTLLHGDFWGGNFMVNHDGTPLFIDPAVYYGHREADFAMTKIFGGFTPVFFDSYHQNYPLKEGFSERQPMYQLYHMLNHLNLFGKGYYSQVMQIIQYYTR